MTDLRFFADTMHAAIEQERRARRAEQKIDEIKSALISHIKESQRIANVEINANHRPTMFWHRATAEVAALTYLRSKIWGDS